MAQERLVNGPEWREDSEIVRNIVAVMLGWRDYEGWLPPNKRQEVIDLNVAPYQAARTFYHRHDIRNKVEELSENLERSQRGLSDEERDYLKAHLRASLAYLWHLDGYRPEFDDYVHKTLLLVELREFEEGEIAFQKKKVSLILDDLGFGADFKNAIVKFREANRLKNEEVVDAVKKATDRFLPALQEFVDIKLEGRLEIVPVEVDAPWKGWLRGEGDSIHLDINLHPERTEWVRGEDERLGFHEGLHWAQILSWQKSIKERKISPASGITTLHTPEQISIEGIALALPLLDPEIFPFSSHGELAIQLDYLERIVLHNAHLRINRSPTWNRRSREEVISKNIRYVRSRLPYLTSREIRDRLRRRLRDPVDRGYEISYTEGERLHSELYEQLGRNPQLMQELIREQFRRPMTAEQIRKFAEKLREKATIVPTVPHPESPLFASEV